MRNGNERKTADIFVVKASRCYFARLNEKFLDEKFGFL